MFSTTKNLHDNNSDLCLELLSFGYFFCPDRFLCDLIDGVSVILMRYDQTYYSSEIMKHHSKIPELVASQDLMGCVEASKSKLELLLSLGTQLITGRSISYTLLSIIDRHFISCVTLLQIFPLPTSRRTSFLPSEG